MNAIQTVSTSIAFVAVLGTSDFAAAQDDSQELAKKLSNPIASLISVPFQFNYDEGFGSNDGERAVLNIQPSRRMSATKANSASARKRTWR